MKFFVDEVNIGPLRLHSVYYADMTKARAGETNFAVGTGNAIQVQSKHHSEKLVVCQDIGRSETFPAEGF